MQSGNKGMTRRIAGPGMSLLLMLGLAACSATPFDYRAQNETPEGEGMLTGDDGAVVLSNDDDERTDAPAPEREQPNTASVCECVDASEMDDYRRFLRWKADVVGTPEYREFRDWREWRRQQPGAE